MSILGIDLGTSSIKLLLRHEDGQVEKARFAYSDISVDGWWSALVNAARTLNLSGVKAVGLSGQVGTYIINGSHILSWSDPAGLEELQEIKARYDQSVFRREITMPHPDIISYPIPRLMHIMRAYKKVYSVCAPKDMIIEKLTGTRVTDVYSWRGLANLETGEYSRFFLNELGIDARILPPLTGPSDQTGVISPEAARATGLPVGTPVYAGCNDFFAALAGSGIHQEGDLFDITGTSEHIGGITDSPLPDAPPVSGRYFSGYVRYGVTASSGQSLDFGRRLRPEDISPRRCQEKNPPLFLPYLNGERCPVCDPYARGVFFGINGSCDDEVLAYSIMEGVAFNLKQILETLGIQGSCMIVSGGAAQNDTLNQLKADILGMRIAALDEPDASALGAAMLAAIGTGAYPSLSEVYAEWKGNTREFEPQNQYDYAGRFELYKQLYPTLREQFNQWGRISPK